MKSDTISLSPLTAISPIDGRYHKSTAQLARYFSEYALIRYRLQVEIQWLKTLAANPQIKEVPPLSHTAETDLEQIITQFSIEEAQHIKQIEAELNHDVKAVEQFLRAQIKSHPELSQYSHIIHIACTSEDINSTAYALMIKDTLQQVLLPNINQLITQLQHLAKEYANLAMLSLTHGQPASPTTLGKEFANFCYRLHQHINTIQTMPITAKWNGAVGNYNAHISAWGVLDWLAISQQYMQSLGLQHTPYTTQIEPRENLAELLNTTARISQTLTDFCRDIWGYISRGILVQKVNTKEVGSSTMPHKVNPIDFENAEGNLGLTTALADHLSRKLVISRWQRDLSDSTVMRSLGSIFGYLTIALDSIAKGCSKITPNEPLIADELAKHPEVLTEVIQTVLRCYGMDDAYNQMKDLTRGKEVSIEILEQFIKSTPLPEDAKKTLLALRPETYTGIAATLASDIDKHLK